MGTRKKSSRAVYILLGVSIAAIVGIVVALEANRKPTRQEELAQLRESVVTRDPIVRDLHADLQESIGDIATSPDAAKNKQATGQLIDRMQRNLDAFGAASLSDRERHCVKLLGEFGKATQVEASAWQDVQIAMQADPVLAFPKKLSVAELDKRIANVEQYIAATKKYGKFAKDAVKDIRAKMTALNDPQDSLGGYLSGVTAAEGMHQRTLHPMLAVHLARGETMLNILKLLRDDHDVWSGGLFGVSFTDDRLSDQYEAWIESVQRSEAELQGLAQRLVDEMKALGPKPQIDRRGAR